MAVGFGGPIRLSDIKWAIYGRVGYGQGLQFSDVLFAGWEMFPAPGILAKDIFKLGIDIKNFRLPLTQAVRQVMERSIYQNFQEGGRPDPWQPLSDYAVKVRGNDSPILVRTGKLRDVASSFEVWTITDTDASIRELPDSVWYGYMHQSGYGSIGSIGARLARMAGDFGSSITVKARPPRQQLKMSPIPQREFALIQEEDEEKIQDIFIDWLEKRVRWAAEGS